MIGFSSYLPSLMTAAAAFAVAVAVADSVEFRSMPCRCLVFTQGGVFFLLLKSW